MTNLGRSLQLQIIAFVLVFMVVLLYGGRRKLHVIREKVFSALIFAAFGSIILDIVAVLMIGDFVHVPYFIMDVTRKIYLISIALVAFCILLYTFAEVYQGTVYKHGKQILFSLPIIVFIPIIANLPVTGGQGNTFGMGVYASMFVSCLYILISLFFGIKYHNIMPRLRFFAILLATAVFVVCGVIQLYNQELRIMSVGISLIIIYMYFGLETPDVYVDKVLDTFNRDAFHVYLKNKCDEGKRISILYVLIKDSSLSRNLSGVNLISELMLQISNYLKSIKGARVFSNGQDSFMLVFEKDEYFMDYVQVIRNKFQQPWKLIDRHYHQDKNRASVECEVDASFIAYPAARMSKHPDNKDILDTLRYFYKVVISDNSTIKYICIDRKQIMEKDAVKLVREEISSVVKDDRVDVYFQPIFSVKDNICRELEVLMRVRDKRDIFYDNSHIIPVAEESGEIIEIGYEVFRKACRFLASNNTKKLGIDRMAVNLSYVQCQQRDLSERLMEIMERYNVSASNFRFEITENMASYMTRNFQRNINQLVAQGASFAIDDYGNEAVDIELVYKVSRDYIKLGENVVRNYFSGEKSKFTLKFICTILQRMKMQVVAVGVENQQQYAELKSMGVTHMQGNVFSKPLSADRLVEYLENNQGVGIGQEVMFERKL